MRQVIKHTRARKMSAGTHGYLVRLLAALLVTSCAHQQEHRPPSSDQSPLTKSAFVEMVNNDHEPAVWQDSEVTRLAIQARLKKMGYFKDDLELHMAQRGAANLIDEIDKDFLYFTQAEVAEMTRKTYPADVNFGYHMSQLDAILTQLGERQALIKQYVDQQLTRPLNLNQEDRYQTPTMRLASLDEIKQLWNRRIVADAVDLAAHGTPENEITPRLKLYYGNLLTAIQRTTRDERNNIIQNGLLRSVDPQSALFSAIESEKIVASLNGPLLGIGAVVASNGPRTTIEGMVHNGPLANTGKVQPGDELLAVAEGNGSFREVFDLSLENAVSLLRGPKGSAVRLKLRRQNEVFEFALTRDEMGLEERAVSHEEINVTTSAGAEKIAFIKIPIFYGNDQCENATDNYCRSTSHDLKTALQQFAGLNIKGIVVDLRDNGGGSLLEGLSSLSLFTGKNPLLQFKSNNRLDSFKGEYSAIAENIPLVLLVDRRSAGASEIFAAGIQDYHRGIVTGYTTFGLGMAQTVQRLEHGESLKFTVAEYFRVTGKQINIQGITPDILFAYTPQKTSPTRNFTPAQVNALSFKPNADRWNLASIKKTIEQKHLPVAVEDSANNKGKPMKLESAVAEIKNSNMKLKDAAANDVDKTAAIEVLTAMLSDK